MISTSGPVLEARDLYRFFRSGDDETLALRGVSLQLDAGSIVAVHGPSGSGKSTLLSCLAGVDEPDGGVVRVAGSRLSHRPEAERAQLRSEHIGLLFQSRNLLDHLTVRQNVSLVQHLRPDRGQNAPNVVDLVGLGSRADAYPMHLSGGETARAGLAVAIANNPDVLLADEPTGELDSETEQLLLALLRRIAEAGCGILVVTHSPAVVAMADRTIELLDGQVVS